MLFALKTVTDNLVKMHVSVLKVIITTQADIFIFFFFLLLLLVLKHIRLDLSYEFQTILANDLQEISNLIFSEKHHENIPI